MMNVKLIIYLLLILRLANQYNCVSSCPSPYDKLIEVKKKCIDDCKNDDEYIYEYNGKCLKECPVDLKIDIEEKKCLEECKPNQFEFNNECYNENSNNNGNLFQNGNIIIRNNSDVNSLLSGIILSQYLPERGNSLIIQSEEDDVVHQITNSQNELELLKNLSNSGQNISILDLGECEEILKKIYNIKEEDSLIIIKSEILSEKASQKKVKYEIYEPYNKTKLNLSFCDDAPVNLYIPMELSEETKQLYEQMKESGYDMFDINDPFYQDICIPFDSENGTDILLSDRVNYIYNNDNTQCQNNCQFSYYSMESKFLNCTCSANEEVSEVYESFYDVLKYSNYDILKCANLIKNVDVISINIGSLIVILYFLFYLGCLFFYIYLGLSPLKIKLKYDLNEEVENNNLELKVNLDELLGPPIKRKTSHKLMLRVDVQNKKKRRIENNRRKTHMINRNNARDKIDNIDNLGNIQIYSNIVSSKGTIDVSPKEKIEEIEIKDISKLSNNTNTNVNRKETKNNPKVNEFSDFELNELEYNEALKLDKRSFLQIYWATLKREHLIIFTFINCTDYNLLAIKLTRFIFLVTTDMALNVFFFSDDSMHKLFLNYGKYDFIQQIPQITYSTIISQLIEVLLCFLSLTDKHMYSIKTNIIKENTKQIEKAFKCMNIKLIIFYCITCILFFAYWYIISVFCGVYRNTQIAFIKDSAISFSFCLTYPFILYLISSSLRICALRDKKRQRFKCIYDLSYVIPFF